LSEVEAQSFGGCTVGVPPPLAVAQIPTQDGNPAIPVTVGPTRHSSPGAQSISPQQVGVPWLPENIVTPT
jgi:hypothetical protein